MNCGVLACEVDDCAEEESVHEELHDAVGVASNQQRRRRDTLPVTNWLRAISRSTDVTDDIYVRIYIVTS